MNVFIRERERKCIQGRDRRRVFRGLDRTTQYDRGARDIASSSSSSSSFQVSLGIDQIMCAAHSRIVNACVLFECAYVLRSHAPQRTGRLMGNNCYELK